MESVFAFIREFKISSYGLDGWDVLIITGLVIFGFILLKRTVSFITPKKARFINRILTYIFYLIVYGVWAFIIANSILTDDYGRAVVISFILILPALRKLVSTFYERYDNWIDRIADRK